MHISPWSKWVVPLHYAHFVLSLAWGTVHPVGGFTQAAVASKNLVEIHLTHLDVEGFKARQNPVASARHEEAPSAGFALL